MRRKYRSFRHQSGLTHFLLLPAWCLTGLARALVLLLPFKYYASLLGQYGGVAAFIPLADDGTLDRAISIGRAIRMSATLAPWNANCQAQAIAARWLLGLFSVPYSVFYGVAKDPVKQMKAHAWVCCGPVQVTGGYAFNEYTVVAVFSALYSSANKCMVPS